MFKVLSNIAYDRDSTETIFADTYHTLAHLDYSRIENLLSRGLVERVPDHLNDIKAAAEIREPLARIFKIVTLSQLEAFAPVELLAAEMSVEVATVQGWILACKAELAGPIPASSVNLPVRKTYKDEV